MTNTNTRKKRQSSPKELALRLAANHLRSSGLPVNRWRDVSRNADILRRHEGHRVIFVVGAGASACAKLPTAKLAIEELRKNLVADRSGDEEVAAELRRLEKVSDQDPARFETAMRAFCLTSFRDSRARNLLSEMYRKRHIPILSYELIAHLFKHRFVDAVINFNFDEELDQSIADELNPDEYRRVISDGDWPVESAIERLYIKPHGTSSVPSTLRYTRDAYWGAPSGLTEQVRRLITTGPVVVVTVGFSLTSFEFNDLLDAAPETSELFCLDIVHPSPKPRLQTLLPKWVPVEKGIEDGAGRALSKVCACLAEILRVPTRSIGRHELVANLFGHRRVDGTPADTDYFRNRTLVEVCLAFAKGKGLVNLSELANDRAGVYFSKFAAVKAVAGSLSELCDQLGLAPCGYGHETMTDLKNRRESPEILGRDAFKISKKFLLAALRKELSPNRVRTAFDDHEHQFSVTMDALYRGVEVEIRADRSVLTRALFRSPKPLENSTALYWHTRELLRGTSWNTLLVVAETGEWLLHDKVLNEEKHRRKRICLIPADCTHEKELRKRLGDRLHVAEKLDWWDHNRHMTLLLHDNTPVGSIYFSRRMRSLSVSPVELDGHDSETVLDLFIAYWIRSRAGRRPWISARQTNDQDAFFHQMNECFVTAPQPTSSPRS